MKKILVGILVLLAALIAFISFYSWDAECNRGYETGYWGSFNRVSNTLARLPGVAIVNSGHNADVTMEEFGFDIRTASGRTVHVWFSEDDPVRNLSGEKLREAIRERVEKETGN